MSDLNFVSDGTIDRIAQRKQHMEDIRRDAFRRRLKAIADECEEAMDHCRALIRAGSDVSEELKELDETGAGLQLVAKLFKLEAERSA